MRDLLFTNASDWRSVVVERKYEGYDWPTAVDFIISNTARGIDIILSLNIQQKCIHFLIVVEKVINNL
jgi:hypothetical protein